MNDERNKYFGLHSRDYVLAQLEKALVEAKQQGKTTTVLFTGIDSFKILNCSLGHVAGDVVLRELADVVQRVVGDKGMVCLFAKAPSDEFLVVLPSVSAVEAKDIAEQICGHLAKQPVDATRHAVYVTMTIGIASYPANGQDAESLLRAADEAMLQSKKSGRRGTISTA